MISESGNSSARSPNANEPGKIAVQPNDAVFKSRNSILRTSPGSASVMKMGPMAGSARERFKFATSVAVDVSVSYLIVQY